MSVSIPSYEQFSIHGVCAALVTPMNKQGELDCDGLQAFVEHLIAEGVNALIPLGSTGEYYALSDSERECVIRCTLQAAAGRVPVVAGANAGSTADVIRYARQAQQLGCAGLMLAAPYYSLPTAEELFRHFAAVNSQIDIPIMLYNYPGRTGVDMSPELIERLSSLANVRYVKESTGDMTRVAELIRRCGDSLGVLCGCDTLALESLAVGAIGWVGGVVNVVPAAHCELFSAMVQRRDLDAARSIYYQLLPLLHLMEGGGKYTQYVKAACRLAGYDVGAPRAPLQEPAEDEIEALRSALRPWL